MQPLNCYWTNVVCDCISQSVSPMQLTIVVILSPSPTSNSHNPQISILFQKMNIGNFYLFDFDFRGSRQHQYDNILHYICGGT